jgi:hypothetical protein
MSKDKDAGKPQKDFRGFLRELGVRTADFHYTMPDISGYPCLKHHPDYGEAYGMNIDVEDAPDQLVVRPAEIDFSPLPYVEDFWYRLEPEEGIVAFLGEGEDYLNGEREIKVIPECVEFTSVTVDDLKAIHARIGEAAKKFGFKLL